MALFSISACIGFEELFRHYIINWQKEEDEDEGSNLNAKKYNQ